MNTEKTASDESMDKIHLRQVIEAGLSDSRSEKTVDVAVVRERFGLPAEKTVPQNHK